MEDDIFAPLQGNRRFDKVEVEHLSYEFIGSCKDPEHVAAILEVLQSGREGRYPDLERVAEQKLKSIAPAHPALRGDGGRAAKMSASERKQLFQDISLLEHVVPQHVVRERPPVRGAAQKPVSVPFNKKPVHHDEAVPAAIKPQQRIAGYVLVLPAVPASLNVCFQGRISVPGINSTSIRHWLMLIQMKRDGSQRDQYLPNPRLRNVNDTMIFVISHH